MQDTLCHALSRAGYDGGPVAAGRLDRGVHAKMQLVTVAARHKQPIELGAERDAVLAALADKLNAALPSDVRIRSVRDAPVKAHAMTGCGAKTYTYYVIDGNAGAGSDCSRCAWSLEPKLDVAAMRRAAALLEGEHDFAALCSAPASQDTVRALDRVEVRRMRHVAFPLLGCLCQGSAESGTGVNAAGDRPCALLASEHCRWCNPSAEPAAPLRDGQAIGGMDLAEACDAAAARAGEAMTDRRAPLGDDGDGGGSIVELRFRAPGFLRHQVRRMAALLIAIGSGREDEGAIALALKGDAPMPSPHGASAAQIESNDQSTAHAEHEGSRRSDSTRSAFVFPRHRVAPAPAAGLWLDTIEYGSLLSQIPSTAAACTTAARAEL